MHGLHRQTRSARGRGFARLGLCTLLLAALSGFDWPGRSARDVSALTAAETTRELRDALRLLRERAAALDPALLEEALTHAEPSVRADAVAALARCAEVPPSALQRALTDQAAEVRVAAVELARERGGARLQALLELLRDREPRVRVAAVRALSTVDDARALSALVTVLRDAALDVRIAAVQALAARDEAAALAPLLRAFDGALPELKVALLDALAPHAHGRAALEFELSLSDEDEQVVLAALRGFARAHAAPRPLIEGLLGSPSPAVASAAQQLLARTAQREQAIPTWLPPLERSGRRDLDAAESAAVLRELERTLPAGEERATDALIEWLGRAPRDLRSRIAALAERSGGAIRARDLEPLIAKAEPALRAALLGLLARAPGAAALPAVRRALDDSDPRSREAAARVVRNTSDEPTARFLLSALESAVGERRARLLTVLADALPRLAPATAPLAEETCGALEDALEGEPRLAALSVRALGALRADCGRALVRSALNDHSAGVRIAALRASVPDGDARAKALRAAALRDPDPTIVATAIGARALANDGAPPLLTLTALARQPWPIGPAHAFASATAARDPVRSLCPLLDSPEPITRSNALAGLARERHGACARGRAEAWLAQGESWPARHAAAIWMVARLREEDDARLRGALARCAVSPLVDEVRNICTGRENTRAVVRTSGMARALVLADGRVLVSLPDAAGDVSWPASSVIADVPAWLGTYAKE